MGHRPAIDFRDLTLGYDRHPAVHHIDRRGRARRAARAGRSERRRQVDAAQGPHGRAQAARRLRSTSHGLSHRDIAYLPQQIDIDRSFPDLGVRLRRHGAVARDRHLARSRSRRQAQGRRCARHARHCSISPTARSARSPAGSSSACCSRACCCRTPPHPARRAVPRRRYQDRRRSHRADQALARRRPHRASPRCTTSSRCARISPRRCCWPARSWPGATRAKC